MDYISDIVQQSDFQLGVFNLIDAGCGSGKTFFCVNHLFNVFPGLKPEEVVVITSRSITATQMEQNEDVDVSRVHAREFDEDYRAIIDRGVVVMTYDAAAPFLMNSNRGGLTTDTVKVIVVDECHAVWSDTYIKGIDWVSAMLNVIVKMGNAYVIGLTATSRIVRENIQDIFGTLHDVCLPIPTRYQANHLILTRMKYLAGLVPDLPGKTMIMVPYAKSAAQLHQQIPGSAIMVSKSHKTAGDDGIVYESYMEDIRQHIVKYRTMPEQITMYNNKTGGYESMKLDVLIATTTFREGFNLDKSSGVENIVCCFFDELNITQFLGRCRYSVKNLIIAPPDSIAVKHRYADYFRRAQTEFCELWHGRESYWMNNINTLVTDDARCNVETFVCDTEKLPPVDFISSISQYLNGEWFYSDGWNKIIESAKDWKALPGVKLGKYSRVKISENLNTFGYLCESDIDPTRNRPARYRFIKENKNNDIQNDNSSSL